MNSHSIFIGPELEAQIGDGNLDINLAHQNNYHPHQRQVPPNVQIYNPIYYPMMNDVSLEVQYNPNPLSPRSVSDSSDDQPIRIEQISDLDDFFPSNSSPYYRFNKRARRRRNKTFDIKQGHTLPNLQRFLMNDRFCDMKLVVDGKEIDCHYLILAASSPYFEALLESNMKESIEKRLEINGFRYSVVNLIVEYVYGKTITLTKNNTEDLLQAADYFQLNCLKRYCSKFLVLNLDVNNCFRLISFAGLHSLEKLKKAAKKYSLKHFCKTSQTEEFLRLSLESLVQYLKDDNLYVEREEHVFEAVARWLFKNNNTEHYCEALSCVRYTYLTSSFLYNVVQNSALFREHEGAQKIFQEACKLHALGIGNAKTAVSFIAKPRASAGISTVVVMVGGICSNSRLSQTDCYNSNRDRWCHLSNISTLHDSVHSYSVCAFENNIYITGGHSNIGATVDAVSIYMSNINQWSLLSSMIHPRERHGSAALDGCVYVAGGLLASQKNRRKPGVLELVERYRPSFNKWESVKSLPKRCYSPGVLAYKEKLYIIGGVSIEEEGCTFKTVLDCVQCYNPIDDSWTVRPLGRSLARLSCVMHNDYFYMISNSSNWIYKYDPHNCSIEEWMQIPGNNIEFAGLEVFHDYLLISGGQRDNVTLNIMMTVCFETKVIVKETAMNRSRCMHGCVVINKFG